MPSIISLAREYNQYAYTIRPQFARMWISVAYDKEIEQLVIELHDDDRLLEFAICDASQGEDALQEIAMRACEREDNSVFRKLAECKEYAREVAYIKTIKAIGKLHHTGDTMG